MKVLKKYFTDKEFLKSFFIGLALLLVSVVVQFYATTYASLRASGSVSDIILSNTNVHDVDGLFVYGSIVLFVFVLIECLRRPNHFPFLFKSVAVFTLIRAVFITLTHISPYPGAIVISSNFFQDIAFRGIFSGDGLFFSGHTGLPFLLALMFWHEKNLRYIFLACSLGFAVVVLLGHLHYSIDVLSAFFISYTIFHICEFFFKKDHKLFLKGSVSE